MQMLVGRDDYRGHLGPGEQLPPVLADKVGLHERAYLRRSLGPDIADADPVHHRVAACQRTAEAPDAPSTNDGKANPAM
ncbi:hypothetical protein Rmf_39620 [Roseomonas fluvialis]|uniref:Uncharacterized protein n=1 Tax=Roseomonas fluvialis TaxID=1750527 RepID=A0ABM7Y7M8_9PROT|nr:hypothetical protein Rmf_39620 [Roseomonas fluvialis]